MTFKNNLSCICKNALNKELRDIGNNSELSDHEKVDQMVNKITSVLNCAALRQSRECSKKETH